MAAPLTAVVTYNAELWAILRRSRIEQLKAAEQHANALRREIAALDAVLLEGAPVAADCEGASS